jgi:hypothetical protein
MHEERPAAALTTLKRRPSLTLKLETLRRPSVTLKRGWTVQLQPQPLKKRGPPNGLRRRLHALLDEPQSSRAAAAVSSLVLVTIFVSVVVFYLRTVDRYTRAGSSSAAALWYCELVCAVIFTCELALRLVVATLDVRRLCLCDAGIYIDAAAVVPTFVELAYILASGGEAGSESALPNWIKMMQLLVATSLLEPQYARHRSDGLVV